MIVLAFGGGFISVWVPWPTWIIGGLLALHAGWFVGVWVVRAAGRKR